MWLAFVMQVTGFVIVSVVFLAPGLGRTRENDPDEDIQAYLHGYYGFFLTCYRKALEKHTNYCRATTLIPGLAGMIFIISVYLS